MLRIIVACLVLSGTLLSAEPPPKLNAPAGWGGEIIELPPSFARDMTLKGREFIRFAPGMMRPKSDTFFTYAMVFEIDPDPALKQYIVHEEFLKYYRGLCKAVLGPSRPEVDPSKFTLKLKLERSNPTRGDDTEQEKTLTKYSGILDWVEPFSTKEPQKLNLELWTFSKKNHNYIFVCVSPQAPDSKIWQQLAKIRSDFMSK